MVKRVYKAHDGEPHQWNRQMSERTKCMLCGKSKPARKTKRLSEKWSKKGW